MCACSTAAHHARRVPRMHARAKDHTHCGYKVSSSRRSLLTSPQSSPSWERPVAWPPRSEAPGAQPRLWWSAGSPVRPESAPSAHVNVHKNMTRVSAGSLWCSGLNQLVREMAVLCACPRMHCRLTRTISDVPYRWAFCVIYITVSFSSAMAHTQS